MDFLENFQIDEKCENEAFLHENYIKIPQNTISAKNPILLQIHAFPRIPHQKCYILGRNRHKKLEKVSFLYKNRLEKV